MKTYVIGLDHIPQLGKPLALATGYFDGVHLGHQALICEAKRAAEKYHLASAVLSFNPNPLVTLGKMKEEKYLSSLSDRADILEKMGIDYFLILDFTAETASLLPEEFVERFMIKMNVKEVVCGFDFYFGRYGRGNGAFLKRYQSFFHVSIIDKVEMDQEKISSTRIIALLGQGDIAKVNQLLTRPYHIAGEVIPGKQRGRRLGFPTANIAYGAYYLPSFGVYGVRVKCQEQIYFGMCNIGLNPTFKDVSHPSMEVYIFNFSKDIYHEIVDVYFYCFMRPDQAFESVEELKQQLIRDERQIQNYFNSENEV